MAPGKYFSIFILILLLPQQGHSREWRLDSLLKDFHFEASFGQSLLFISDEHSQSLLNSDNIVVPTSSWLFFTEMRTNKKCRYPLFFNLPTESKQRYVNGTWEYKKASPTMGTGIEFRLFQIKVSANTKIEGEIGPLATLVLDGKQSFVVPLVAGRLRVARGENFIMYMGFSYTFGLNTMGLLYGTGSNF